jgi:hypothetical protein
VRGGGKEEGGRKHANHTVLNRVGNIQHGCRYITHASRKAITIICLAFAGFFVCVNFI